MESVPAFAADPDRERAFRSWELPARDAGYRLLAGLLALPANVIFDHSGANPVHLDLLLYARERCGYRIGALRLSVELTTAESRLGDRIAQTGRFVPMDYVAARARVIDELAPRYAEIADVYAEVSTDASGAQSLIELNERCCSLVASLHEVRQ